jgi:hypothetical protein
MDRMVVGQRFIVRGYVENLEVAGRGWIDLVRNLRIRRVLRDERDLLVRLKIAESGYDVRSFGGVIETETSETHEEFYQYSDAESRIRSVFQALLLFKEKLLKLPLLMHGEESFTRKESFTRIGKGTRFARHSTPEWTRSVSSFHRGPLRLETADFNLLKKFWFVFDRVPLPPYLQSSLFRFEKASEWAGIESNEMHRFVEYVTSMESLFLTQEPEASFKLATRMATLIGEKPRQRKEVFAFMRRAYDLRSKIVHGVPPSKIQLVKLNVDGRKFEFDLKEALGFLHSYSRSSICSVIYLLNVKFVDGNKPTLVEKLDSALLDQRYANRLRRFCY